jgi:hypothetical protein
VSGKIDRVDLDPFSARGIVRAHSGTFIRFPRRRLAAGRYIFAVRMSAEMNPTRQSALVSRPFAVGNPARSRKSK